MKPRDLAPTLREMLTMPLVQVELGLELAAQNHPFYQELVRDFYRQALARHPKFPLMGSFTFGVALMVLPGGFDAYLAALEPSARRNRKKALRKGYEVRPLAFNDHLEEIAAIRASTPVRQGRPVPPEYLSGRVRPVSNPPSRSPQHDYPYYGVFKDGRLVAYAGCLRAHQLLAVEHVLGHAEFQGDAVVPLLFTEMARLALEGEAPPRFYTYGTYFGAGAGMRRFKRKLGFAPHRVRWLLETPEPPQPLPLYEHPPQGEPPPRHQLVFRQERREVSPPPKGELRFALLDQPGAGLVYWRELAALLGRAGAAKALAKLATGRRMLYLAWFQNRPASYGWCSLGFCRHYPVEPQAVVIGPIFTVAELRGRGLAAFALGRALDSFFLRGRRIFYIDTSTENAASRRVIEKCGFGPPVHWYPRG